MSITDSLPWLNLLLLPVLGYLVRIESRITRLESLREADQEAVDYWRHRRRSDRNKDIDA